MRWSLVYVVIALLTKWLVEVMGSFCAMLDLFQYLLKHLRTTGISGFGMDVTGPSEILHTLKFHILHTANL